ncbi:MAG: hypothetical protein ACREP2_07300 [Rhodanobacteraceae bacterium]
MNTAAIDARLTILVTHGMKRELEAEAKQKKTTVGAVVRSRLEGEPDAEEQRLFDALLDLAQQVEQVGARVDATHARLVHDQETAAAREAEAARRAVAALTDRDVAALTALVSGGRKAATEAATAPSQRARRAEMGR